MVYPPALGGFAHLENKGILPHFTPLVSGMIILVAGIVTLIGGLKFNAIPMLVAFGLLIIYMFGH